MPWLRSCKALAYTRAEAVLRYRASWLLANLHGHRTRNSFWIAASICIRLIGPCVGGPVGRLTHSRKAMLVPFLRCHGYQFGGFFIGMPIDRKVGQRSACRLCQLYIVHDRAQFGLSPLTTDRPGGVYSMSVMLVHVLAKASERLLAHHPIHAGGARI